MQGEDGQFWSAQKPDRQNRRPQSSVHVNRHLAVACVVQAFDVFRRQLWRQDVPDKRQPHLSAVAVPGQLQIDRIASSFLGKIWFVRQQDDARPFWNPGQRFWQIRHAHQRIVDSGDVQTVAIFAERHMAVVQHRKASSSPALANRMLLACR